MRWLVTHGRFILRRLVDHTSPALHLFRRLQKEHQTFPSVARRPASSTPPFCDRRTQMEISRTYSMKSFGGRSDTSGNNFSLSDFEKFMQFKGNKAGTSNRDDASDTSSARERKFAAMLGDEADGYTRGGGGHPGSHAAPPRNVGDRLFLVGCGKERVKEQKLREERDRQLMSEMAQMTQRPNITGRARTRPSKGNHFSEHAMMWEQRRQEHRGELVRQRRAEVTAEITGSPNIDNHSRDIVTHRGRYVGPVSGWTEHFAKFCAKRAVPVDSQDMFTPNINVNAVRKEAEVTISERLFAESSQRRERRRLQAEDAAKQDLIDAATGRPLFKPHSLASGGPARSVEELSQQLHGDQAAATERKRQLAGALYQDPEMSFTPKLNRTSSQIAQHIDRKPLYDPKAVAKMRTRSAESGSASPAPVSPVSRGSATSVNVQEFLHRTERADIGRAQRISAIKKVINERETSECTFQPRINSKSEAIFSSLNLSGAPLQSPLDVLSSPFQETTTSGGGAHQPSNPRGRNDSPTQRGGSPKRTSALLHSKLSRAAASEMEAAMLAADVLPAQSGGAPTSPPHGSLTPLRLQPPTGRTPSRAGTSANGDRRASPPATLLPGSPSVGAYRSGRGDSPTMVASLGSDAPTAPTHSAAGGIAPVDQYVQAFERQMYAVLDEWRRLEEV